MSSHHSAGLAMDTPLRETFIPDGLPSLRDAVDGSLIVRRINIIKSIRKGQEIARGGHHSVKMVTAVWPQQDIDLLSNACSFQTNRKSVQGCDARMTGNPLGMDA